MRNINMNMNEGGPIQLKLLCGADLLESFATPGLWKGEDVRYQLSLFIPIYNLDSLYLLLVKIMLRS